MTPVLFAAAVALLLASGAVGALVLAYVLLLRWCDRQICRWSNLTDDAPRHRADPDPLRLPWATPRETLEALRRAEGRARDGSWTVDDPPWQDPYRATEGPAESGVDTRPVLDEAGSAEFLSRFRERRDEIEARGLENWPFGEAP